MQLEGNPHQLKVFIAGATGVLGRRLIKQFNERGHTVLCLVRNRRNARIVASLGGETRPADLFDIASLTRAAEGADVVIHAATAIPKKERILSSDWKMNDRIRRAGTKALVSCALGVGAKIYIHQSIVWTARPQDGSPFDEGSPMNPDMVTSSAVDAEFISHEAGERRGLKVGILRCGQFYSADSFQTRLYSKYLMKRELPIIGRGDAVFALIHGDDAASAFVKVAESESGGIWHVVDDQPVTASQFITGLAERLGAPPPRRVDLLRGGRMPRNYPLAFYLTSTRTTNTKIKKELAWSPTYPTYKKGFDEVAAIWRSEGFPGGTR